ncbi:hypothetical protein [Nocardia beijingensis]|uniref:Uncharacterized protein n=1 Tax=Nocardia beijingensis TaxID=95162 RepID=A0ABW7WFG7_9NOCA
MPKIVSNPQADWNRLKPDSIHAVGQLHKLLEEGGSSQDVLDMYLYTKKLLAESMKALFLSRYPKECPTFHELVDKLTANMSYSYSGKIPDKYLVIRYRSKVHESLFSILLHHMDEPVSADWLRLSTGDSVHTERRTRELRELGIRIDTGTESGVNVYTLRSLEIDTSLIPTIIKNNIKHKKASKQERQELLAILGLDDD